MTQEEFWKELATMCGEFDLNERLIRRKDNNDCPVLAVAHENDVGISLTNDDIDACADALGFSRCDANAIVFAADYDIFDRGEPLDDLAEIRQRLLDILGLEEPCVPLNK